MCNQECTLFHPWTHRLICTLITMCIINTPFICREIKTNISWWGISPLHGLPRGTGDAVTIDLFECKLTQLFSESSTLGKWFTNNLTEDKVGVAGEGTTWCVGFMISKDFTICLPLRTVVKECLVPFVNNNIAVIWCKEITSSFLRLTTSSLLLFF